MVIICVIVGPNMLWIRSDVSDFEILYNVANVSGNNMFQLILVKCLFHFCHSSQSFLTILGRKVLLMRNYYIHVYKNMAATHKNRQ